jgi:hypothetical protein
MRILAFGPIRTARLANNSPGRQPESMPLANVWNYPVELFRWCGVEIPHRRGCLQSGVIQPRS